MNVRLAFMRDMTFACHVKSTTTRTGRSENRSRRLSRVHAQRGGDGETSKVAASPLRLVGTTKSPYSQALNGAHGKFGPASSPSTVMLCQPDYGLASLTKFYRLVLRQRNV